MHYNNYYVLLICYYELIVTDLPIDTTVHDQHEELFHSPGSILHICSLLSWLYHRLIVPNFCKVTSSCSCQLAAFCHSVKYS